MLRFPLCFWEKIRYNNSSEVKDMKEIKITDIKGIQVGCGQDEVGGSGCTVVLCKQGAVAGVDVRGGGPATRRRRIC